VTYGGLLHERRRELHARLAEAIEAQHADRLGEHVERLAHHARRGELGAKAAHYLRQAGQKAAGRSSLADARTWFEHALAALEALPESPALLEQAFDVRIELRTVLNQMGEVAEMVKRLGEAAAVAEKLDDDRRRCRVHAYMTNARCVRGELDEALASGTRALALARALGDLELRILTTSYLNQAHYIRGEYLRNVDLATENLAALPADWAQRYLGRPAPPAVYDRYYLALSLAHLGRFGEAAARGTEAIQLAERMQHPFTLTLAHQIAGMVHLLRGDWAKARAPIEQWVAVSRAGNIAVTLPSALAASAWVLAELGEADEALARLEEAERGLEQNAARGMASSRAWLHVCSGRAALRLERLELADDLGRRAVDAAPAEPGIAAHARHLLGVLASRPDRLDAASAVAHFHAAQALAEPRGMRPLLAHCRLGLGLVAARTGDGASAREHLGAAVAMYGGMDMPFWAGAAEAELSRLGA
jgi:tetratricopeptide (TPR) repeat protein